MSETAAHQKALLRRELQDVVRAIPPETRTTASRRVCELLLAQALWRDARALFLFWPMPSELDTRPLVRDALEQHKTVALPRFNGTTRTYEAAQVRDPRTDLHPGRLGILEPSRDCPAVELIRLDFVLVPGLGFGLDGRRLGRGKGFYDRMLAHVGGWKCGIAFDEQIIEGIPLEPHDVCVDCLLTPACWRVVKPRPVPE